MILNPYSAWYDETFLIKLATDEIKIGAVSYNYNFYDQEDSCYAFMKGKLRKY